MRKKTRKQLIRLIYGKCGLPPGGSPHFDLLVELINDEVDEAVDKALAVQARLNDVRLDAAVQSAANWQDAWASRREWARVLDKLRHPEDETPPERRD